VFTGLGAVPLADVVLDAMTQHPGDAVAAAVRNLNEIIGPTFRAAYAAPAGEAPAGPSGMVRISHPVQAGNDGEPAGEIHLFLPSNEEQASALHFVTHLASLLGKVMRLQQRHASLQKLAITDDLTGLYNGRYFRHFLSRIMELSRRKRFPVTLFTFDIDNFKQYNDQFGHCCGDEILKQTATLIKRCVREHDHVARIGGDEFAVVFWEKDAPRQPHHEGAGTPGRPPTDARPMLQRFQSMLASQDLTLLGASGKGQLTISGGLAVYPWDASDIDGLIKAADEALMFGAKKGGKNSITLVGAEGHGEDRGRRQ
jgi:GGDEF domain-containing protein